MKDQRCKCGSSRFNGNVCLECGRNRNGVQQVIVNKPKEDPPNGVAFAVDASGVVLPPSEKDIEREKRNHCWQ